MDQNPFQHPDKGPPRRLENRIQDNPGSKLCPDTGPGHLNRETRRGPGRCMQVALSRRKNFKPSRFGCLLWKGIGVENFGPKGGASSATHFATAGTDIEAHSQRQRRSNITNPMRNAKLRENETAIFDGTSLSCIRCHAKPADEESSAVSVRSHIGQECTLFN